MSKNILEIYFSPSGRSKKVSKIFSNELVGEIKEIDLFEKGEPKEQELTKEDLLVVTLPVFSGRIPNLCVEKLKKFKGNNTKAVAIVAYGNREYDDALLELTDLLGKQGFEILAAAAFITRHSIFSEVANNRPDEDDIEKIKKFARECNEKIDKNEINKLDIKGNRPYKEVKPSPLMPTGDESCIDCGTCVEICPVEAISIENPRETDRERCINCTACIYNCSTNSRGYHIEQFKDIYNKFKTDNAKRKEPEIFL
ncbi:EFR1 family ferrodoxin [Miniphocaeibacter massiliensis]|uniref:EFR1 family ferrodoxin n=1 Tax=Miniphocaeibacter massiliensis TaxID=2041841 RepID=UPI000C1B921D|nr:EFR1 family ferrodoxin [Miniphocaeibacter massiliensis]